MEKYPSFGDSGINIFWGMLVWLQARALTCLWLPSEKINLLICYVLVLTLFSDEFRTDYTDIAKDLSMNILPVRQLYEHLGCKISPQKNILYATLPVPLKFPELRLRKRKR
ncbi:hypothetical protein JHK87_024099 [Glycine soja]|nr:hypothetical protein JHK87_024099 [Glycine soja]